MNEDTISAFSHYCQLISPRFAPEQFNRPAAGEMDRRLKDLDYLLDVVGERERRLKDITDRVHNTSREATVAQSHLEPEEWTGDFDISPEELASIRLEQNETRIFTEAFYYFAARIISLIRHDKPRMFPGLTVGQLGSTGVRRVRDTLLEHYAPTIRLAVSESWGRLGIYGPTMRTVQGERKQHDDKGLYANAREFRDELDRRIAAAVARYA
jgi:hypothetical protein